MLNTLCEFWRGSTRSSIGLSISASLFLVIVVAWLGMGMPGYQRLPEVARVPGLPELRLAESNSETRSADSIPDVAAAPASRHLERLQPASAAGSAASDGAAITAEITRTAQPEAAPLEAPGRTRCLLSRRGIIAPAVMRPVVEVLAAAGDHVTKGQVLVKLYDLEPQAKVRARENELKSIEAKAKFSRRNVEIAEAGRNSGAVPETTMNDIRATALSNEGLVLAAQAELALAQGELKLYTVTAAIDGEIEWLDVSPGTVTWPGSLIWGEIVDLSELDVRCQLTPAQADQVRIDQSAEVRLDGKTEAAATGKVVLVGKVAERNTGLVPVTIRVANPDGKLRAEVVVQVRFQPPGAN